MPVALILKQSPRLFQLCQRSILLMHVVMGIFLLRIYFQQISNVFCSLGYLFYNCWLLVQIMGHGPQSGIAFLHLVEEVNFLIFPLKLHEYIAITWNLEIGKENINCYWLMENIRSTHKNFCTLRSDHFLQKWERKILN